MADNTIESHKELASFLNSLITILEKSDTRPSPTIENFLSAVCKALRAQWAGIIIPADKWTPLYRTPCWPKWFPTKKQVDFLKSQPMLESRPFSLESEYDLKSLGLAGARNVAIVPFKWALVPVKSRFLIIGNKERKLKNADDLPYYTLPLLRTIAQFFALSSGLVEAYKFHYYTSKKSWELALLSGSRTEIKNRAEELKGLLPAEHEDMRDEIEASRIDAELSLQIVPTRRIHNKGTTTRRGGR